MQFMSRNTETLLVTSRFRVDRVFHETRNGELHERAIVRHPGAVTILPMVDEHHVCLIRNFRISVEQTLIELPAGTREANETPEKTAARELVEETGYRAERWSELTTFYTSPGIMDERMHLFVAEDLEQANAALEPGEEIENLVVTWNNAMEMVFDGTIRDAKSIAGLLYFDRLRRN